MVFFFSKVLRSLEFRVDWKDALRLGGWAGLTGIKGITSYLLILNLKGLGPHLKTGGPQDSGPQRRRDHKP